MSWLVVASKPQQESRAEVNLRRQFMLVYCPRIFQRACTKPLFPGYLFVQTEHFGSIANTYGVRALIMVGDQPATVSDDQIQEIKSRAGNDGIIRLNPYKHGDKVNWGNIPAMFEGMIDDDRCSVLFSMLGKTNHKVLRVSDLTPSAA
jgi:transcription antitermination factor NusG